MVFRPYVWEYSAEVPLRTALHNRITAATEVDVFNGDAPENFPEPYIILGESTEGQIFTKTNSGSEIVLTVHIYTREDGYDKLDEIKAQVIRAISGPPMPMSTDWSLFFWGVDGSRQYRFNAELAHCVITFRFKMDYVGEL